MKLAEMFDQQDTLTFEERRSEVVAIVRSAADFEGTDSGLRTIFLAMSQAQTELEFDQAFNSLVSSLSENTARYLQSAY
jgi:hypothetical protein